MYQLVMYMKNYLELVGENVVLSYKEKNNIITMCSPNDKEAKNVLIKSSQFLTYFDIQEDEIRIQFADGSIKKIAYSKEALVEIEKRLKFQYQLARELLINEKMMIINNESIQKGMNKIWYKIIILASFLAINESVFPEFYKAIHNLNETQYTVISASLCAMGFFIPEIIDSYNKREILKDFYKYQMYYEHQSTVYNYFKMKENENGEKYIINNEIAKLSKHKLSKIVKNKW